MSNYYKLKEQQPILVDCFFAFSNKQYEEAIKIVVSYFGSEKAKSVKRRYAGIKIEEIKFN